MPQYNPDFDQKEALARAKINRNFDAMDRRSVNDSSKEWTSPNARTATAHGADRGASLNRAAGVVGAALSISLGRVTSVPSMDESLAERAGSIPYNLEFLHSQMEGINNALELLAAKMSPVIRLEPNEQGATTGPDASLEAGGANTPLGKKLQSLSINMRWTETAIRALADAVEL